MRLLFIAAAALTLAACNKPAEEAPAAEVGMETSTMPHSAPAGAMAPSDPAPAAAADTMGAAPAGGMMSGPSQATRDMAKEKAESTNLHPAN